MKKSKQILVTPRHENTHSSFKGLFKSTKWIKFDRIHVYLQDIEEVELNSIFSFISKCGLAVSQLDLTIQQIEINP